MIWLGQNIPRCHCFGVTLGNPRKGEKISVPCIMIVFNTQNIKKKLIFRNLEVVN